VLHSADFADARRAAGVKSAVVRCEPTADAIAAVLAGDGARFGEIVRAFDAPVRRVVAHWLRDAHALDDVVQEVWIRVHGQLASLLDAHAAAAWIARIARNCALDHRRADARRPRPARDLDAAAHAADAGAAGGGWVWELVDALPDAHRELLTWCYRDGDSHAAIAMRLAVPASTVRGRLYDARLQLRAAIERRRRT
jgi:RNA polymerase sigma-70 factor (ECF subfamily)